MGDRSALVTGGSSGIGLATARLLLDAGYRVAIAARNADRLAAAAETLGGDVHAFPGDVGDPQDARRLVREARAAFGRLDALVNNAGVAPLEAIGSSSDELIELVLRVNTLGPAAAIAEAWATFVEQNAGVVVNVSSYATKDPFPGFFAYAASKSAAESLVRSVRNEGDRLGIRGYAVAPGAVETPMLRGLFDAATIPEDATLSPELVAGEIVGCVTGETEHENGSVIYLPSS